MTDREGFRRSLQRWRNFVPPDAKPRYCKHCGNTFVIICDDSMFQNCGNFLAKRQRLRKIRPNDAEEDGT